MSDHCPHCGAPAVCIWKSGWEQYEPSIYRYQPPAVAPAAQTCPMHGGVMLDVLWRPGEPETICIACLRDNKDRAVAAVRELRAVLLKAEKCLWPGERREAGIDAALAATAEWEAP